MLLRVAEWAAVWSAGGLEGGWGLTGDSFCHEIGTLPTHMQSFLSRKKLCLAASFATLSALAAVVGGGGGGHRVSSSFRLPYLQEET